MVVDAVKNLDDGEPAEVDREDGFWMIFFDRSMMMILQLSDESMNWVAAAGPCRESDAENRRAGWWLML